MLEPSSSEKIRRNIDLRRYLEELSALTGRQIRADELGSIEQAASIREDCQKFSAQASRVTEIPFPDRKLERFKKFVRRLSRANAASVYVWTPRTISCGVFLMPSIDAVRFDFDFAINEEGILVFVTSDLEDRLLLDYSNSPAGGRIMKVETQGTNWVGVTY
jgi:hypothetical protein